LTVQNTAKRKANPETKPIVRTAMRLRGAFRSGSMISSAKWMVAPVAAKPKAGLMRPTSAAKAFELHNTFRALDPWWRHAISDVPVFGY